MTLTITLDSCTTVYFSEMLRIYLTNVERPQLHLVYFRFIIINKTKIILMMHIGFIIIQVIHT